jgi:hypothetical protein
VSITRIIWSNDVGAADWVIHRLRGATGTLGSLMPADFNGYVCIPHPGDADVPRVEGTLPPELAGTLASIAAQFTGTAQRCWFGLWHGYGWLYASRAAGRRPASSGTLPSLADVEGVPRVKLANREFLLYKAPIDAATTLTGYPTHQTPNLWWPDDRAWYIMTDIDLTSTYVGGALPFLERMLAEPRLAARPASLEDPLIGASK